MKTTKQMVAVFSLAFVSMVLVGVLLNTYSALTEWKAIDAFKFNNILLKSVVISAAVTAVIILFNYKKLKNPAA